MNKFEKKVVKKEPEGWYKGYFIEALREQPEHSDFGLVAEYDALQAKKNVKKEVNK